MRTQTITLYSLSELKEAYPEAYKRVLSQWKNRTVEPDPDVWHCLAVIRDRVGKLTQGQAQLTGRRAWAWLENTLLAPHRIPWTDPERWHLTKYGSWYRAGMVKPCPFTGVCYDESYLEDIRDSIRLGHTVGDAMSIFLNQRAEALADEDVTYQLSENAMNDADDGEDKYTSEGVEWN